MGIMQKRSLKLGIGFLVLLFMGVSLAWSVFVVPIEAYFGWSRSQTSLAFTVNIIFFSLGSVAAGSLSKRFSFGVMLKAAAVMVFAGFFLASRMNAVWQLYLGYGVLVGGGVGMGYNCVLSAIPLWFPEMSATATGTLLMGYALSTAVFGPILNSLIGSVGILTAFLTLAVVCGAGVLIFGTFICIPTFEEMNQLPHHDRSKDKKNRNVITADMVKLPLFWVYYLMTVMMPGIGIAMINHNSPILTEVLGTSASFAAAIVSLVAVCNGLARFCFGFVFDRLGVKTSAISVSIITAAAVLGIFLGVTSQNTMIYIASICLLLVSFGCNATMMPSMIRELFGHRTFSLNYSILATDSIITAFYPTIVGSLRTASGSYTLPLMVLMASGMINLLLLAVFLRLYSRMDG